MARAMIADIGVGRVPCSEPGSVEGRMKSPARADAVQHALDLLGVLVALAAAYFFSAVVVG